MHLIRPVGQRHAEAPRRALRGQEQRRRQSRRVQLLSHPVGVELPDVIPVGKLAGDVAHIVLLPVAVAVDDEVLAEGRAVVQRCRKLEGGAQPLRCLHLRPQVDPLPEPPVVDDVSELLADRPAGEEIGAASHTVQHGLNDLGRQRLPFGFLPHSFLT